MEFSAEDWELAQKAVKSSLRNDSASLQLQAALIMQVASLEHALTGTAFAGERYNLHDLGEEIHRLEKAVAAVGDCIG